MINLLSFTSFGSPLFHKPNSSVFWKRSVFESHKLSNSLFLGLFVKQTNQKLIRTIIISGKRMLPLVLTTCYCLLLSIVIWTIVDVNINNTSYRAYIIEEFQYFKILAGINVGLGFFPLTSFLVYYWISIFIRGKETTNQEVNETV